MPTPPRERVIRATDRLLFVSAASHPHALDSATRASYEQQASDVYCFYTPAQWVMSCLHRAAGEKMCHLPQAAKLVDQAATPANAAKRLAYGAGGNGLSGYYVDGDGGGGGGGAAGGEEVSILVCGWRAKWNSSTAALRARVDDLAQQLTPGPARIIFLNQVGCRM